MFSNKKGLVMEGINLGLATIIIIVLAIIFFIFSNLVRPGISGSLIEESENLILKQEAEQSLLSYLQTPVKIERNNINQEITIYDLIILANNEKAYEEMLKLKSLEIFDSVYEEYSLAIGNMKLKRITETYGKIQKKTATIEIPINSIGEKIEVKLMLK